MQAVLALLVEYVSVVRPVQFLVEINTQVFERVHYLNVLTLDVHQCVGCACPTEVYHHLFFVTGVKEKVVLLTPFKKVSNN